MSAHVVPKAPSFSEDDEKTTIESGWEDEPSTTVESGDVAERIRSLVEPPRRFTGFTQTGAHEELTADDQRANAAISMLTPPVLARLVVTQGNDTGAEVQVRPDKTYTIGRGLENDIVLTDIAVSRKHFDLRHEAGAWVLVDRGSGNGTLVNGNLEDAPFMLANGDAIEIGNTTFRFEQANGAERAEPREPSNASYDIDVDSADIDSASLDTGDTGEDRNLSDSSSDSSAVDEESSTVAGKPLRTIEVETVTPARGQPSMYARPKTLPPPNPSRPRSPTNAPPSFVATPLASGLGPLGQAPMRGGAVSHPQAPTLLGEQQLPQTHPIVPPNTLPTTIPGQGIPTPATQPFPHPQNHAQMLVINSTTPQRDGATAHVPPTPYNGLPIAQPAPYVSPQLSRHTKMVLGGIGLTVLAAIATIAIIKGSSRSTRTDPVTPPPSGSSAPKPSVEPLPTPTSSVKTTALAPKATPLATVDPKAGSNAPPKLDPPKTTPTVVDPPHVAVVEPPAKVDPPKVDPPHVAVAAPPPKVDPPHVAVAAPPPKVDPPKVDPPKTTPKLAKADPPKVDPPKVDPPKTDKTRTPKASTKTAHSVRVATADTSAARAKAEDLYRAKNFSGAAATLKTAASSVDGSEASGLKTTSVNYELFGKAYNLGMAPATKPADAVRLLQSASSYDSQLAGSYENEIKEKLRAVAPRAASFFLSNKDYEAAFQAVRIAEANGGGNGTTKAIRENLEGVAGDLYKAAIKDKVSDPDGAKQKLHVIQRIVDAKSNWFQKAGTALSDLK